MKSVEDMKMQTQDKKKKKSRSLIKHKNPDISNSQTHISFIRICDETLTPSGVKRHTRSRQLRLVSTLRPGKLSAHNIITSDTQMT